MGGWCWWYRKDAPGDTELEGLESEARGAKKACALVGFPPAVGVAEEETE